MARFQRRCLGQYDFEHIAHIAKRRFVDGESTISLLQQAHSEREREETALVCLLDVDDDLVLDIQLDCRYAKDCKVVDCRARLRRLIETELRYLPPRSR